MFVIYTESPVRVSQEVANNQLLQKNQTSEPSSSSSPQPPPRGRHNPFNKAAGAGQQSPQRKDNALFRKTFKELHNQLGRPILRDRNEWRFGLIKQDLNNQESLITL